MQILIIIVVIIWLLQTALLFGGLIWVYTQGKDVTKTKVTEVSNLVGRICVGTYYSLEDAYNETIASDYKAQTLEITEDIQLLACLTIAEAGGEDSAGQRYVIDTILNRVDSEDFPDNIYDVIYDENQYYTAGIDRAEDLLYLDNYVRLYYSIVSMIHEEMLNRTNTEVLYFRTEHYHNFGTELFQHGNHYFSGR